MRKNDNICMPAVSARVPVVKMVQTIFLRNGTCVQKFYTVHHRMGICRALAPKRPSSSVSIIKIYCILAVIPSKMKEKLLTILVVFT